MMPTHREQQREPTGIAATVHDSIEILGDSDFITQGWPGSGTIEDPYVISDLDISGPSAIAIYIEGTDAYFEVTTCYLHNQVTGIQLVDSNNGTLDNNTIDQNSDYGIYLDFYSDHTTIINNTCSYASNGIFLGLSNDTRVTNNTCKNNNVGIYLLSTTNSTLDNNNCSGNNNDGIYLVADYNLDLTMSGDTVVNNGGYGIEAYTYYGDIVAVIDRCNVSYNGYGGIYLEASNNLNLTMSESTVSLNNWYGVEAYSDSGDTAAVIDDCNISENYDNGIYIEASNILNMTLTDSDIVWNDGSGVEAYSDNDDVAAIMDGCNVSDNGWTGIYLWAQVDLNLTLNNSNVSGNDQSGGWSSGIEAYASSGNLDMALTDSNLSYNGNEGIYAEAYNNLNMTMTESIVTWNDLAGGYSCGIEAYASYGNLNMSLTRSDVSDQADEGLYLEAGHRLNLTLNDCNVTRNTEGEIDGLGIEAYAWGENLTATVDGCNISDNYDGGIYLWAQIGLNLTFNNSDVTWNGGYGIEAYASSGNLVALMDGCNISNDYYSGIYLYSSADLNFTLTGSNVSWNGQSGSGYGNGFEAYAGNNIVGAVDGCNISDNYNNGIYLTNSYHASIANTTCSRNGASGMYLISCDYDIISNNTCARNGGNGILLSGSVGNRVTGNKCTDNLNAGVMVDSGASGNTIDNNTCSRNSNDGIQISSSDGNYFRNNTCSDNGGNGVYIVLSNNNEIVGNLFRNNALYGVRADSFTSSNRICNNTIAYNNGANDTRDSAHIQAYDDGTNFWNSSGTPNGYGNYWNDWTTPDADENGIVDNPYLLDGWSASQDNYPLTIPTHLLTKTVQGQVSDQMDRPLPGAHVSVTIMNGKVVIATKTTTTDANGYYVVTFDQDEWGFGYTIDVTAQYGEAQQPETIVADGSTAQTADVQFPFEIPQFGNTLGFLLAGALVGVVAMVFLKRRRRG
jgi:parallel beta-helix repeat protein